MTGMRLKGPVGIGAAQQQAIHNEWDTFDKNEAFLARMGFPPLAQPEVSCPQVTDEILTTADDKLYTETYAALVSWRNYCQNLYSRIEAKAMDVVDELKVLAIDLKRGAKLAASSTGDKKPTKDELDEMLWLDPRYKELKRLEHDFAQQLRLLRPQVDSLNKGVDLMSRQVEIRRQELTKARERSANYPGRIPR